MRRRLPQWDCEIEEIRAARNYVGDSVPVTEQRKQAVRKLRKLQRQRARRKGKKRLQDMAAGRRPQKFAPVMMKVDGSLTADRRAWLADAESFGKSRF
eukprot:9319955-Karenia_brevis.AAC.1